MTEHLISVSDQAIRRKRDDSTDERAATPIQAKLSVGPAGDQYEQEADVVADRIVQALRSAGGNWASGTDDPNRRIQRRAQIGAPEPVQVSASRIQRMTGVGAAGGVVDAATEREIKSGAGGGRPLPDDVRAGVEQAFGADFGDVRIHEGARATDLNDRIQAKAFTTGSDIYFRDGLPDMSSGEGQHLLAHELTHTIQQGAVGSTAQRTLTIQRFLDPAKRQKLDKLRAQLKTALQSPKGKGKGAANRKKRIAELREEIAELETLDQETPEPGKISGATLTPPPTGGTKEVVKEDEGTEVEDEGVVETPTPKVEAPAPKVEPPAPKVEPQGPKGEAPTPKGKGPVPVQKVEPIVAPVVAPVVAEPVVVAPDLKTESLREAKAALAEHLLKTPGKGKARSRYNQTKAKLEAKVAELEAEIVKQHPVMSAAIGKAAAQEIANAFEPAGITELGKVVPASQMEVLCASIGAPKLRAIVDAFDTKTMWSRIQTYGVKVVQDLLSVYTAAEWKAVETAIGQPRFANIVRTKAVPAAAIKHYGTAFMRTFAGATETTWDHLISIKYNNQGAISGGHDEATFNQFVADQGVRINWTQNVGANKKVNYTTFWNDGSEAQTGSKTLVPNLIGKKVAMMASVNDALWNAIANQAFRTDLNDWVATTRDGTKSFSGFYRNGNIDTFFPQ